MGLAGCTFVTPQTTTKHYDASDGVTGTVGDVKVLNALAITGGDDVEGANLVFSAVNSSDDDVDLTVQFEASGSKDDVTAELAPGLTKIGSGDEGQFLLEGADAVPGALLKVYFQYGDEPGKELLVPVLDSSWAEYADLVPTAPPTPTTKPAPLPTAPATDPPATDG